MLEDAGDLGRLFSQEEIETQARDNLNGVILGSLAYAQAHGQDGREWATFMGQAFAPAWTTITTPRAAAVRVALNCASAGMRIVSVEGDATHAETVTGDWPQRAELEFFGLTQAQVDQLWEIFQPIAHSLGYSYAWRRKNGQLHFTLTRA